MLIHLFLILIALYQSNTAYGQEPSRMRILDTGHKRRQARADLIYNAKDPIFISTLIWNNDDTGEEVFALLREAARRGIPVTFVGDAVSALKRMPSDMLMALIESGVKIELFNMWGTTKIGQYGRRFHGKIVQSGTRFITGGANMSDEYMDRGENYWSDLDVVGEDKTIATEMEQFGKDIIADRRTKSPVNNPNFEMPSREGVEAAHRRMDLAIVRLRKEGLLQGQESQLFPSAETIEMPAGSMKFISNVRDTKSEKTSAILAWAEAVRQESDRQYGIRGVTPYVVLTKLQKVILEKAIRRGVPVSITAAGAEVNDAGVPALNLEWDLPRLASSGFTIKLHRQQMHHEKIWRFGRTRTYITSANLNYRSQNIDNEIGLMVDNEEFARQMDVVLDAKESNAVVAAADGRFNRNSVPPCTLLRQGQTILSLFVRSISYELPIADHLAQN